MYPKDSSLDNIYRYLSETETLENFFPLGNGHFGLPLRGAVVHSPFERVSPDPNVFKPTFSIPTNFWRQFVQVKESTESFLPGTVVKMQSHHYFQEFQVFQENGDSALTGIAYLGQPKFIHYIICKYLLSFTWKRKNFSVQTVGQR